MNNEGPFAERAGNIYAKLRSNLISNMSKQFEATGYIWEQYNDETGKGQRSRPFAGWSALVVLIISESYH
jgi:mannosyl-oligosaccharide glucosidase